MQLSPRDHMIGTWHVELGDAEISIGHFDAAIDEYRRAIDSGTRTFFAYTNLAAAYAHAGKMEDAQGALVEARKLNPKLTVKWMIEHTPNLPAVFDGVRKAGLRGMMLVAGEATDRTTKPFRSAMSASRTYQSFAAGLANRSNRPQAEVSWVRTDRRHPPQKRKFPPRMVTVNDRRERADFPPSLAAFQTDDGSHRI